MNVFEKFPLASLAAVGSTIGFNEILPLLVPALALVFDLFFKWLHYKNKKL